MATVSFDADIKPIFTEFVGKMRWRLDLSKYEDVRANAQRIYTSIRSSDPDGRMPPFPFDPLPLDQIARFKAWMDQGFAP